MLDSQFSLTDTEEQIGVCDVGWVGGVPISDARLLPFVEVDPEAEQREKREECSHRPEQKYRSPYHFIRHMLGEREQSREEKNKGEKC